MKKESKNNTKDLLSDKFRNQLLLLPTWLYDYLEDNSILKTIKTKIAYSGELIFYLNYFLEYKLNLIKSSIKEITVEDIVSITHNDIQEYIDYCKLYRNKKGEIVQNNENGIKRKLCVLRSLFKYLQITDLILGNPTIKISIPSVEIDYSEKLDNNDINSLIEEAQNKRFAERNIAIIKLILSTGIRVSECFELNIEDISLDKNTIKIIRNGNDQILYFNDDAKEALELYLPYRGCYNKRMPLFLSSRGQRISIRSIEVIIKNYANNALPDRKITSGAFRKMYKNKLYQETKDVYLVASVLGFSHKHLRLDRLDNEIQI